VLGEHPPQQLAAEDLPIDVRSKVVTRSEIGRPPNRSHRVLAKERDVYWMMTCRCRASSAQNQWPGPASGSGIRSHIRGSPLMSLRYCQPWGQLMKQTTICKPAADIYIFIDVFID